MFDGIEKKKCSLSDKFKEIFRYTQFLFLSISLLNYTLNTFHVILSELLTDLLFLSLSMISPSVRWIKYYRRKFSVFFGKFCRKNWRKRFFWQTHWIKIKIWWFDEIKKIENEIKENWIFLLSLIFNALYSQVRNWRCSTLKCWM